MGQTPVPGSSCALQGDALPGHRWASVFGLSPCSPQLRTQSLWYPLGTWQGMLLAPALQGGQQGYGG